MQCSLGCSSWSAASDKAEAAAAITSMSAIGPNYIDDQPAQPG
jgi:hypothetical protein